MPQTAQQLKGDIDSGHTGDKIPESTSENGFDPGLATLGTDDEAAGTPNTPEQVALARALETQGAPSPPEQSSDGLRRPGPAVWMVAGAFVAAVVVIAAALWIGRG